MENQNNNALVITRIFDAPRELVWKAWTDPEMFKKWWGPKDFTCPVANIDFRVGGKYHVAMHGPAGSEFDKDLWSTGVYREIVPMEKIVMTDSFADEQGNVVPATHYGMGMNPDFPMETEIIITFEEQENGKTKMTLRHVGMPAGKDSEGANQGWSESFDKLAESLK